MARFAAFFLLAVVVSSTYAFTKPISRNCGLNEVFEVCGTACEPTCQNPEPQACVAMCKIGCRCQEGFIRRHLGGICIPSIQCLLRE